MSLQGKEDIKAEEEAAVSNYTTQTRRFSLQPSADNVAAEIIAWYKSGRTRHGDRGRKILLLGQPSPEFSYLTRQVAKEHGDLVPCTTLFEKSSRGDATLMI